MAGKAPEIDLAEEEQLLRSPPTSPLPGTSVAGPDSPPLSREDLRKRINEKRLLLKGKQATLQAELAELKRKEAVMKQEVQEEKLKAGKAKAKETTKKRERVETPEVSRKKPFDPRQEAAAPQHLPSMEVIVSRKDTRPVPPVTNTKKTRSVSPVAPSTKTLELEDDDHDWIDFTCSDFEDEDLDEEGKPAPRPKRQPRTRNEAIVHLIAVGRGLRTTFRLESRKLAKDMRGLTEVVQEEKKGVEKRSSEDCRLWDNLTKALNQLTTGLANNTQAIEDLRQEVANNPQSRHGGYDRRGGFGGGHGRKHRGGESGSSGYQGRHEQDSYRGRR